MSPPPPLRHARPSPPCNLNPNPDPRLPRSQICRQALGLLWAMVGRRRPQNQNLTPTRGSHTTPPFPVPSPGPTAPLPSGSRPPVLAPGGQTTVAVAVTGADGTPEAAAEVAVWVVDEAVLLLAPRPPHPLGGGRRSQPVTGKGVALGLRKSMPRRAR